MTALRITPQFGFGSRRALRIIERNMLVYKHGLPPLGDTGIHLVLTEVPGDLEPAYLTGRTTAGSKFDRVSVDGNPGYWRSAGNRLPGQILLWEQRGVALRLEANVKKEQAIRIAESAC